MSHSWNDEKLQLKKHTLLTNKTVLNFHLTGGGGECDDHWSINFHENCFRIEKGRKMGPRERDYITIQLISSISFWFHSRCWVLIIPLRSHPVTHIQHVNNTEYWEHFQLCLLTSLNSHVFSYLRVFFRFLAFIYLFIMSYIKALVELPQH